MFQFVAKKTRNVRSDRWKKVIQTQKQNSAKQTANADITEESIPETTSKKPKAKTNKNNNKLMIESRELKKKKKILIKIIIKN